MAMSFDRMSDHETMANFVLAGEVVEERGGAIAVLPWLEELYVAPLQQPSGEMSKLACRQTRGKKFVRLPRQRVATGTLW